MFGEDLFKVISNLAVSLLYTTTIWKMFVCNSKVFSRLVRQLRDTEKDILSHRNKNVENIYYKHVKINHFLNVGFIWLGGFTIALYYIRPVLEQLSIEPVYSNYTRNNVTVQYQIRPLPLSSWFPFNRYKYYYWCYLYHFLAATIGGSLTVSTDIFFVALMTFTIGQLEILQYLFKNTKQIAMTLSMNVNISYENALNSTVKYCVNMHKIIIKYVEDLDKSMKYLMFVDFAIASMQMAMLGLQMIVSGVGWQQMFALEFLIAMLVQLFLFYWHGNEIMLQSTQIASSIWESEWIDYKEEIKRSLELVILRSQKPLTLSVGPFYFMSTETALSILRAAYSYVAVIRQMYIRKS